MLHPAARSDVHLLGRHLPQPARPCHHVLLLLGNRSRLQDLVEEIRHRSPDSSQFVIDLGMVYFGSGCSFSEKKRWGGTDYGGLTTSSILALRTQAQLAVRGRLRRHRVCSSTGLRYHLVLPRPLHLLLPKDVPEDIAEAGHQSCPRR